MADTAVKADLKKRARAAVRARDHERVMEIVRGHWDEAAESREPTGWDTVEALAELIRIAEYLKDTV